jgi:hypothetical protein
VDSADQVEGVKELSRGLQPEGIAGAKVAGLPSLCDGVGVRSEEVTDEARVGDGGGPRDTANAVEGIEVGGDTALDAEYLSIDDRRQLRAVEDGRERLPDICVVMRDTLRLEPEIPIHRPALVVAAQKEEAVRVQHFVGKKEADTLNSLRAAVDVVTEEKICCCWWIFTQLEDAEQVVVLPVDIAVDGDWGTQLEKRWLRKKDRAHSITQTTNSRLLPTLAMSARALLSARRR